MDFEILDANSVAGKAASAKHGWDLGPRHGIAMERGDEVLNSLSGHSYGEQHIRDMIEVGLS